MRMLSPKLKLSSFALASLCQCIQVLARPVPVEVEVAPVRPISPDEIYVPPRYLQQHTPHRIVLCVLSIAIALYRYDRRRKRREREALDADSEGGPKPLLGSQDSESEPRT
ncbi:hypothetical protein C8F01DRAFT_1084583 [Mycena amicta]|nr:hypothetical protein C8F01DRAFT_1084583 [Mycena amicta]